MGRRARVALMGGRGEGLACVLGLVRGIILWRGLVSRGWEGQANTVVALSHRGYRETHLLLAGDGWQLPTHAPAGRLEACHHLIQH